MRPISGVDLPHEPQPGLILGEADRISRFTFLAWKHEVDAGLRPLRPYAFHGFRVLTVISSPARIDSMIAHVQKLSTKGRGLFLFTHIATLTEYKNRILSLRWRNEAGRIVRLTE